MAGDLLKIIITSVGSLVGQNILESLQDRRGDVYVIGTNSIADAAVYECDKVYLLPETSLLPGNFNDKLLHIIQTEKPDIVIPGRDLDVLILSMLRNTYPEIQGKLLCGSEGLAVVMEDKWESYIFSVENNLPFAQSATNHINQNKSLSTILDEFEFPLLVKPRKGFASQSVHIITNRKQLEKALMSTSVVVQEYLGNRENLQKFISKLEENGVPLFFSLEEEKKVFKR